MLSTGTPYPISCWPAPAGKHQHPENFFQAIYFSIKIKSQAALIPGNMEE